MTELHFPVSSATVAHLLKKTTSLSYLVSVKTKCTVRVVDTRFFLTVTITVFIMITGVEMEDTIWITQIKLSSKKLYYLANVAI